MSRRQGWWATVFASAAVVALAAPPLAGAKSPRQQLVETYAPITMLRAQEALLYFDLQAREEAAATEPRRRRRWWPRTRPSPQPA